MEFKFRAADCRPPQQYASSRQTVYGFSKQGLPDPCLRRNTNTMRKPFDINEAMHCELELMRLREEKLLVEIEKQRFLKEEARRELMLVEREMAIRGVAQTAGYHPVHERWVTGTSFNAGSPAVHPYHGWQPMEQLKSSDRRCLDAVPLLPLQQFMAHASKPQVQADKSELIVLDKPDPKLFSEKQKVETEKRKVETPSAMAVDGIHPWRVKKNPKDEWSCALCRVTVSSERTFNQHLHGKKHKRKEADLRAQKASNISQAAPGPLPKKRRKLLEAMETIGSAGAQQELKVGESLQCEKTRGILNPNTISSNFLNVSGKVDKQQHEAVMQQKLKEEAMFVGKMKFKFWCKMCKVGAYDEEVMAAHLNGKKHKTKLSETGPSVGQQQPL